MEYLIDILDFNKAESFSLLQTVTLYYKRGPET